MDGRPARVEIGRGRAVKPQSPATRPMRRTWPDPAEADPQAALHPHEVFSHFLHISARR